MKRLTKIPEAVLEQIKEEQRQKREQLLVNMEYKAFCTLPIRPVRMRLYRKSVDSEQLEQTIVPATNIFLRPDGFIDEDHLDRNAITYAVAGTNIPFPFGHIYKGSGHVCLGSIFVPSKISKYSPQQPLETLFLHNDRNLNHGDASLILNIEQVMGIKKVLSQFNVNLTKDAADGLIPRTNMLTYDSIWLLATDVYNQISDLSESLRVMSLVYKLVFKQK